MTPHFNQVFSPPPPAPQFFSPPPPPYQEDLPQNHCYKAGTRIIPTHKLILQFPSKETPNLDSTYEHAYCYNPILPRPGVVCLEKSRDLETPSGPVVESPSKSSDKGLTRSRFWRSMIRKVTKKRLRSTPKLRNKSASSGFKQRFRSVSCDYSHHTVQIKPANHPTITSAANSLVNGTLSLKPPTLPPRGIVKPPRTFKKTSLDNSTSFSSRKHLSSDEESSNSLVKIKKAVSFANICTSTLTHSTDYSKEVVAKSYVVNGYVFTDL